MTFTHEIHVLDFGVGKATPKALPENYHGRMTSPQVLVPSLNL